MLTTWQKDTEAKEYPSLKGTVETDVVIIGGGITGIALAYNLTQAGKKVVVIEKGSLRKTSTTAYTTAFLAADIDTDLPDLVSIFGKKKAKSIWQSGLHAIDCIEKNIKKHAIECEFKRVPEFWFATSKGGYGHLKEETKLAHSFGFDVTEIPQNSFAFDNKGAFVFAKQAKYHPLKYLIALREKAIEAGAVFYEHTKARTITGNNEVIVTTTYGSVHAKHVIQATYQPFENPSRLFAKKGMYISYVYEFAIGKDILPEGLYLDDMNPYHYFRVDKGETQDRVILGGEDHRKELPIGSEKNYAALKKYFAERFPTIPHVVVTRWSGPILEPIDGLPFIGRYDMDHPNRFVATAFSGNGMTYAHLAAEIITGEIIGKKSEYANLYDPMRQHLTLAGLWIKTQDYVGEFFGAYLPNLFK
jgi:glycine/D-amino acid oxidase-like deaminating enzyme